MYARSTTIQGDSGNIDTLIAFVRDEVTPAMAGMQGHIGMSMVADRENGRCIATSSWDSEESRARSFEALAGMRARGGEILGGSVSTEDWEIALMHREHEAREGSWCRLTWLTADDVGYSLDFFKTTILPRLEAMDGFISASMVNRDNGHCCGTVRFDSQATLISTRERSQQLRDERAAAGGLEFTRIDECELVLAHLRVPELV
jgi:heme-degrading monooxygenase HmoA